MSAALKSGKRKEKLDRICLYLRYYHDLRYWQIHHRSCSDCLLEWESFGILKSWHFLLIRIQITNGCIWEIFSIWCRYLFYFLGKKTINQIPLLSYIQGVWVFLTFVCKRNVLQVITKGRDELYSVVKNKVKQTSIGSGVFQYIP